MNLTQVLAKLAGRRVPDAAPAPLLVERRVTHRVRDYWASRRNGHPFPARADIDPADIPELWPWCFVIDVARSADYVHFDYLGRAIAKYSGIYLSGEGDWSSTVLDRAAAAMSQVVERREPLLIEDELKRFDGRTVLLRAALLPLSADGIVIDHVFGAANGKLVEDLA